MRDQILEGPGRTVSGDCQAQAQDSICLLPSAFSAGHREPCHRTLSSHHRRVAPSGGLRRPRYLQQQIHARVSPRPDRRTASAAERNPRTVAPPANFLFGDDVNTSKPRRPVGRREVLAALTAICKPLARNRRASRPSPGTPKRSRTDLSSGFSAPSSDPDRNPGARPTPASPFFRRTDPSFRGAQQQRPTCVGSQVATRRNSHCLAKMGGAVPSDVAFALRPCDIRSRPRRCDPDRTRLHSVAVRPICVFITQ